MTDTAPPQLSTPQADSPGSRRPVGEATYRRACDLVYLEAELLDDRRLDEWYALFAEGATYRVPIDEAAPASRSVLYVNDFGERLAERVLHLHELTFPAQSPPSRTVHVVGGVRVDDKDLATGALDGQRTVVARSSQAIFEVRSGDVRQVGLAMPRVLGAHVEHVLLLEVGDERDDRIQHKTVRLIERGLPLHNLTFLL